MALSTQAWLSLAAALPLLLYLYIRTNDAKISRLTPEAVALSPRRWTDEEVRRVASEPAMLSPSPSLFAPEELGPKTGRRYIVIGGAGFLGGWIVLHLIARGEDPRRIRILDIRRPIRQDLLEGPATQVDFCQVDVSDAIAVEAAFSKPWPSSHSDSQPEPEVTVFHTAAVIRFYERSPALQVYSDRINVEGTKNVVAAARKIGASTLVYSSSGSVSVRSNRFLRWPWEGPPEHFVQPINGDDEQVPKRHEDFFSNYAVSKWRAEQFVREADRSPSGKGVLRTGCIRPGNGIYGPGGDLMLDAYMLRKNNPSWIHNMIENFIYVENCSVAHLAYEQRLIELQRGSTNPDIGGKAFVVADAGLPPTNGEVYRAMTMLSDGEVQFMALSATAMLMFAYLVESYYLARHALLRAPSPISFLAKLLPALHGDIVFLQPSMWSLTQVHLIFDDSRARESPEKGGLGYNGHITTLQGLCKVVVEHRKTGGKAQRRVIAGHQSPDHGFGLGRKEKSVEDVIEKLRVVGNGHKPDKSQVAELQY
ncbi:NAD-P-binding protein [Polyporus arcularius HHB13444]|uniref:NAD-P-binding protein n=1 Tax=Polyporus arcularius HHB13444 TaxID=1314778 RepID=A0A5C3P8S0_9APHY|nr:NAD-P-binding protein [Polyporus arcularius HHB13444]